MALPIRSIPGLAALTATLLLLGVTPVALLAQTSPSGLEVQDLPLPSEAVQRFAGRYAVTLQGSEKPPMSFLFFGKGEALMGQINDNDPTRMLYQGGTVFRPEDAPVFVVTFTVEGDRATALSVASPEGTMEGVRVAEPRSAEDDAPVSATSGPLYDELARLDSLLFTASFVTCDTQQRNALFTEDVEFYHDRGGFSPAEKVRAPITECPRDSGLVRQLVEGSLEVYPMQDYGAIQMGLHRFVEPGRSVPTVARFVHLWQKKDGVWKISRVLSFDHHSEAAPAGDAEK